MRSKTKSFDRKIMLDASFDIIFEIVSNDKLKIKYPQQEKVKKFDGKSTENFDLFSAAKLQLSA